MSRINEKLGLKPAGTRARTHVTAESKEAANAITRLQCPACLRRYVVQHAIVVRPGESSRLRNLCGHCGECWDAA